MPFVYKATLPQIYERLSRPCGDLHISRPIVKNAEKIGILGLDDD